MGYIKVYFSEQNLALSQLIRLQCKEILNPRYTIVPSLLEAKDLADHNGDKYVKVFLSENEHKKLQLVAKERGIGMSRLIYERLHAKSTPIEIKYETDDIYERDKERLLSLGYETRNTLKEYIVSFLMKSSFYLYSPLNNCRIHFIAITFF